MSPKSGNYLDLFDSPGAAPAPASGKPAKPGHVHVGRANEAQSPTGTINLFAETPHHADTPLTLPDLSAYDRFVIDTETNGLSTTAEPVGISIATPDGKRWYLPWGHGGGGNGCSLAQVQAWAAAEFTRPHQTKIFFNAPFDLRVLHRVGIAVKGPLEDGSTVSAVLNERERSFALDRLAETYLGGGKDQQYLKDWVVLNFGVRPNQWKDHLWRVPGDIVAPYAEGDADLTLRLFDARRPLITAQGLDEIYAVENALIPLVVKMHLVGVRVDKVKAEAAKAGLEKELQEARARWDVLAPGVNPMSTDQLAPLFRQLGLDVGRTDEGNDSITKAMLDEQKEHEVPRLVKQIRELEKFAGTFITNYILQNVDGAGLIHGEFHPLGVEYIPGKKFGTVSGRFSSGGDLCLQNFPGDQKPQMRDLIRGLFVPYYPEQDWVKADSSQIEYRYLAHYAGDPLRKRYNDDPDVDFHQMLTDLINNPICPRPRTKNVNFAIAFGAGIKTAAATAGISMQDMQEIFKVYHERTENCIKNLSRQVKQAADSRGYIRTWGGRRRRFMGRAEALKLGWHVRPDEQYMETHKALNALIQGSAADHIKKTMLRVAELVDWENTLLHLTVHDELDCSVPKGGAGTTFCKRMREAFEDWPLSVPLRVEIARGPDWGHCLKMPRASLT